MTEILLGFLVIVPAYAYCMPIIVSAMIKYVALTFHLSVTVNGITAYLNLINDGLLMIAIVAFLYHFMKRQWKDFKKNKAQILFYGCVIGMVLTYGASIIGSLLVSLFTNTTTSVNQNDVVTLMKSYPAIMFFSAVIFAPILEECLFRGLIFTFFRKYNRILAYVISGFLFGFVHVMSSVFAGNVSEMIQMIPYALMGTVFAYIYESQDNIYASIATHMTNNLVSLLLVTFTGGLFFR